MRKCEVVHVDQGPIGCTLLHFAVPVLISQLLQEFYNIADCAVVGRFGGDYALAATGTAGLLLSVLINFFIGFSSGVSVETARLFGGKQYEPLKKTLQSIFRLAAGAGCLFTVFGLLLTDRILVALHCPPEIHGAASVYFRICLLGIAAQLIYNVGTAVLRSLGDTVSPMRLFGASALLNLVLDLLLVAGFSLGVAGAAWATLISQCFLGLAILWRFSKLEPEYRPVWTAPGLSAGELRRILQSGIPAGMQAVFMSISSLLVQISINSFGAAAVAGMTVYAKLASSDARSVLLQAQSVEDEIYYVYAMGHLDGTFRDPAKAVQRADEHLGVVLNRSQQYVWERGNKKEQVMLNLDDIPEIVKKGTMDKAALEEEIGEDNTILDLTGCTLDSVLYEVSAGRPVLARTGENSTVVITGYDAYNTWLLDQKSKEPYAYGMEESEELFEKAGNVFITYLENVRY